MKYVALGRSGLVSSVIGLGGGSSGRFGLTKGGTKADAIRLIRSAVDQGITFFDGAGIVGGVDELLADGLAGCREDVLLSTKVHLGPEPVPFAHLRLANRASSWLARRRGWVCSAATLRRRVERTLRVLRTDRIDVLHLHAVSPRQYPLAARLVPELAKMKEEGKLRAIGVTEAFLRDPGHAMLRAAVGEACVDTIMVGFNVRNASAAEFVIPKANQAGIGVIGMFALRGLLGDADEMTRIAQEAGIGSLSELAYRYCRHQAGMHVVLTGTGNRDHLSQNIAAALAPPLSASVLERLRRFQAEGASSR
jgi:aryl-alcohol dehydrogenase-like predicted oxidoreductase